LFRAKQHEEDIVIVNELTKAEFPVSLKAYGDGPLQLSTDSNGRMFPYLLGIGKEITDAETIKDIFRSEAFADLSSHNVMPLIYREKEHKCNIMVFDQDKVRRHTKRIVYVDKGQKFSKDGSGSGSVVDGKGRKHPLFIFLDVNDDYICEVRYGIGDNANALQRGFWTHTVKAFSYFESMTDGWIDYSHNLTLVRLFSLALNSTEQGHKKANKILQADIDRLKKI